MTDAVKTIVARLSETSELLEFDKKSKSSLEDEAEKIVRSLVSVKAISVPKKPEAHVSYDPSTRNHYWNLGLMVKKHEATPELVQKAFKAAGFNFLKGKPDVYSEGAVFTFRGLNKTSNFRVSLKVSSWEDGCWLWVYFAKGNPFYIP